jgi:glyoxylate reductase
MAYQVLYNVEPSEQVRAMLSPECKVHAWSDDEAQMALIWPLIEGVLIYGHPHVDGPLMDKMPRLRVISNTGVGVDHIVLDDARQRGIPVGNTPNVLDGAVADMTFALILAVARNLVSGVRHAHGPDFHHYEPDFLLGHEVYGSTLGIVGLGNIGQQVARRARGFEMRVLYHNRRPDPQAEADLGVTYAALPELLRQSDYVSLSVPLTAETRGLIGRDELATMQETAFLINMARGAVVDQDALVAALRARRIAGAALDVTDPEPLPRDHPLLGLENVLITPHLGSATVQTRRAMHQMAVDNLLAGLAGRPLVRRKA